MADELLNKYRKKYETKYAISQNMAERLNVPTDTKLTMNEALLKVYQYTVQHPEYTQCLTDNHIGNVTNKYNEPIIRLQVDGHHLTPKLDYNAKL
jgi:hypothetical protein